MAYLRAIFSFLIRVLEGLKDFVMEIEYALETSLFPQKMSENGSYKLELNWAILRQQLKRVVTSRLLKRREKLFIIAQPSSKRGPKIIQLIAKIGGIGGAQKVIFDLINHLGQKFNMEVVTLTSYLLYDYPNLRVNYFPKIEQTRRYFKKINPDIIHFHYYGDWYKFHQHLEAILALNLEAKIVENVLVPIQAYRSPKISHYVFVSKYVQKLQHKRFENETVIYPGINLSQYKPLKNKFFNNAVGMVYRLFDDKIDKSTIELFIKLVKERPETLVYIVGYGINFHHYVERTRQEGVRNNFYFTGCVAYSELPKFYDKFDVFVAPVHKESYGVVVPYAMAKNIPIVAYKIGVLPELLGKTNILCDHATEMVEAIKSLLDNRKLAKGVSKDGRARVKKLSNFENMIERYKSLYLSLLN